MAELIHKELTGKILRSYYNVYNGLSRYYREFIYENSMIVDLAERGLDAVNQPRYKVLYLQRIAGLQILDVVVSSLVVLELKAVPVLLPIHHAQLQSYLKATQLPVGFLLNFHSEKPEFKRYVNTEPRTVTTPDYDEVPLRQDVMYPELSLKITRALRQVHRTLGPGLIHRIYANACYYELENAGLSLERRKSMEVFFKDKLVGRIASRHIIAENLVMIFPMAIGSIEQVKYQNIQAYMKRQNIELAIVANFNSVDLQIKYVTV
jgi:GxxExxY protein